MKPKEIIGDCHLYLGDCRDVLPNIPSFDLVLTDPPYGLGKRMKGGSWGAKEHDEGFLKWDLESPHDVVEWLISLNVPSVIWGGNYFRVPPSRCWLLWNKVNAVQTMSDIEMAWTNYDRPSKRLDLPVGRVEFGHPTQKPIALIEWCLDMAPKTTKKVVDPFMGSGTTGVACANMGKTFYGVEKEQKYFDIACKRIEAAYAQGRLFA